MPNTKYELVLLACVVDKLHGDHARVVGLGELLGCTIQGATKPITLWRHKREKQSSYKLFSVDVTACLLIN